MNASPPQISVIVPVYNVGNLVRTCVGSILSQDFADFELILVDDGSTDDSGCICDEFTSRDSRVSVIHKKNGNSASARNAGLDRANGEFVVFVDADDSLRAGALRTMLTRGISSGADLAVFSFATIGRNERLTIIPEESDVHWDTALRRMLLYRFPSQPWAKLYKKSLFDGIRFDPRAQFGQDLICNMDALIHKRPNVACFPDVVYNYVLRPTSNSFQNRFADRYKTLSELADERLHEANLETRLARELSAFRALNLVQVSFKTGKPPRKENAAKAFLAPNLDPDDLGSLPSRIAGSYRRSLLLGDVHFRMRLLRLRVARTLKGGPF